MPPQITIFLSYAHADSMLVHAYKPVLELHNPRKRTLVWIDNRISAGTPSWWLEILMQIRRCEVFIPMLTQQYCVSRYCMTELRYAQALNKPILPLKLDGCSYPAELASIQALDLNREEVQIHFIEKLKQALQDIDRNIQLGKHEPPHPLPAEPDEPGNLLVRRITSSERGVGDPHLPAIDQIMDKNPAFIYDDVTLGDAYFRVVGGNKQPYLLIKNEATDNISGWISKSMVTAQWPTMLWQTIGIKPSEHRRLVDEVTVLPVAQYMIQPGRLQSLTNETFLEALSRFIEPTYQDACQLHIRAFPVLDSECKARGVLAYWHLLESFCRDHDHQNWLFDLSVHDCMLKTTDSDYLKVYENSTFRKVEQLIDSYGWTSVAVTADDEKLIGMISRERIKEITDTRYPQTLDILVKPHLRRSLQCPRPDNTLRKWLRLFILDRQIDTLPVVEGSNNKLVGLLRYIDILKKIYALFQTV